MAGKWLTARNMAVCSPQPENSPRNFSFFRVRHGRWATNCAGWGGQNLQGTLLSNLMQENQPECSKMGPMFFNPWPLVFDLCGLLRLRLRTLCAAMRCWFLWLAYRSVCYTGLFIFVVCLEFCVLQCVACLVAFLALCVLHGVACLCGVPWFVWLCVRIFTNRNSTISKLICNHTMVEYSAAECGMLVGPHPAKRPQSWDVESDQLHVPAPIQRSWNW